MMRLLYYATLFLTISHVKDAVFLFSEWKNSIVLNDAVRTFDMVFMPLISAFFLEASHPGIVTARRLTAVVALQASFFPLFLLFPDESVVFASMAVAFTLSLITIGYVLFFSARYHEYIAANYSYYENIDVTWVRLSCMVYFLSLFAYSFAFEGTTWLSEALYNIFSLVLWTVLLIYARRHRVIKIFMTKEKKDMKIPEENHSSIRDIEASYDDRDEDIIYSDREEKIAVLLTTCMEKRRIYLNPKVTLSDIAQAIGTNRTYLSDYLNNTLNTTFYDYINTYRIKEACRIIDAMHEKGKKSMVMVAEMSGFNSKSSFNRYFTKVMGESPKSYYTSRIVDNSIANGTDKSDEEWED